MWTAVTTLAGGRAVHYRCDEGAGWLPDLADIAAKVTSRTRAIVIISPNNPTGAVYPRDLLEGMLDLARRHHLMVLADEIYDKILYDGAVHYPAAVLAPDLLCLTFNGLSKSYRVAGFRSGWLLVTGPASTREATWRGWRRSRGPGCARTCRASSHSRRRSAAGRTSATSSCRGPAARAAGPGLAAAQRHPRRVLRQAAGAMYAFPRLDPAAHRISDDEKFVLDLLLREKIQVVQGTGFNWPYPDHFRIVTLPRADDLDAAIARIGRFLAGYRQ